MASLEFADIGEAFSRKDNLTALGTYTKALAVFEGRDKMMKTLQFASRFLRWHSKRNGRSGDTWDKLYKDTYESRKASRFLETWTKLNKCFEVASAPDFNLDSALTVVADFFLLLLWHFDYLAHSHRQKFVTYGEEQYKSIMQWPGKCWLVTIFCQFIVSIRKVQRAADSITVAQEQLDALKAGCGEGSSADPEAAAELEQQVKDARFARFNGWLGIVKAFADFNCASVMSPALPKKYPQTFGWQNDGVVGVSGVFSALCVIWGAMPSKPKGGKSEPANLAERNVGALLLALIQVGSMVNHQPGSIPTATA